MARAADDFENAAAVTGNGGADGGQELVVLLADQVECGVGELAFAEKAEQGVDLGGEPEPPQELRAAQVLRLADEQAARLPVGFTRHDDPREQPIEPDKRHDPFEEIPETDEDRKSVVEGKRLAMGWRAAVSNS